MWDLLSGVGLKGPVSVRFRIMLKEKNNLTFKVNLQLDLENHSIAFQATIFFSFSNALYDTFCTFNLRNHEGKACF